MLPISLPPQPQLPTPVQAVGQQLHDADASQCLAIKSLVETGFKSVAENPNFTQADFWLAQGTNGAAVLSRFAGWINILNTVSPDLVTDQMTAVASAVTVHSDGTVTVNA